MLSLPRETLLGQLTGYSPSIHDDFTSKSPVSPRHKRGDPASAAVAEQQAPPNGNNMPDVTNNVVWTRQLEAKVKCTLQQTLLSPTRANAGEYVNCIRAVWSTIQVSCIHQTGQHFPLQGSCSPVWSMHVHVHYN